MVYLKEKKINGKKYYYLTKSIRLPDGKIKTLQKLVKGKPKTLKALEKQFIDFFLKPEKEGICSSCEGELYQRDDDKEEVIQNRLNIYKEQTQPLIEFYKNLGLISNVKVTDINQTPDELVEKVLNAIEEFNKELKESSVI